MTAKSHHEMAEEKVKGCGSLTWYKHNAFWSRLALRVLGGREKPCLFMSHYYFGFSVTYSFMILTEICKNCVCVI